MNFGLNSLSLDPAEEVERISRSLRNFLVQDLRRRGLVVGLSGGIDSSVTAALAVRALGKNRVYGLLMPDRDSGLETRGLSRNLATVLGIDHSEEEISPILEAAGFYRRYDAAVQSVVPAAGPGWKSKIVTSGLTENEGFTFFTIVAQSPAGETVRQRLPLKSYLEVVAAMNFKQRTRKMLEYYHADRLNYAVAGTPNRLEYDQGFFVKGGDGLADLKPIAHLYKCQVYALANYLGLPDAIRCRPPTTDTYSLPQGQDEFYFTVPHQQLDLCLYGKNHGLAAETVAAAAGLAPAQVRAVWTDIERKRSATRPLHLPPLLVDAVPEIHSGLGDRSH
jgi:NAD+ synthase